MGGYGDARAKELSIAVHDGEAGMRGESLDRPDIDPAP